MVELATFQAVSYIMGSLGVFVAAVYYVMNLRINEKNRKTQLSMSIAEKLTSKEFLKDMMDVFALSWTDVNDYLKKYDSTVSPESYVLRNYIWSTYDNLGYLIWEGLIEPEIIYKATGGNCIIMWEMYKPVFDYYREKEHGPNFMIDFEYLAKEMYRIAKTLGYLSPDHVRADGSKIIQKPDIFK